MKKLTLQIKKIPISKEKYWDEWQRNEIRYRTYKK
jgi:hypothetical protein